MRRIPIGGLTTNVLDVLLDHEASPSTNLAGGDSACADRDTPGSRGDRDGRRVDEDHARAHADVRHSDDVHVDAHQLQL